ncbi:hypothetical protein MMC30_002156 [Trapelia coarctata]|nr:hypothetical protein [Trapelia coarctata]
MPPFIPRKRQQSTPPSNAPTPKRVKKPSLFDTVDQAKPTASIAENQRFLDSLGDGDGDTSLNDVDSSDFEDALPSKLGITSLADEDEDEVDWEDAVQRAISPPATATTDPPADLELTLHKGQQIGTLTNPHDKKKGPSKIERQIRTATHCMHVQFLLFHNLIRNAWVCDKAVQEILVAQLPDKIKTEVEAWRRDSGIVLPEKEPAPKPSARTARGAGRGRGHGRGRNSQGVSDSRGQRDWGEPAERQERGVPNMSRGDPVIRLLKYLSAYWRKKFRITAPGLRKQGYKSLAVLEEEVASFHNDKHDPEEHGERIADLESFRECARRGEGSRDVGAQLFTALVRGLGLEARLVASLQPIGFSWSKTEEANPKKRKKHHKTKKSTSDAAPRNAEEDTESEEELAADGIKKTAEKSDGRRSLTSQNRKGKVKGGKDAPIDLSDGSELSSDLSSMSDKDDDSVVDVTPSGLSRKPNMSYDKDMPFPTYWTEVVSSLSYGIFPVDPLVLVPAVATGQDQLAAFEPRGAKADKAKQVISYVVAYSPDGTAKDVTTRYLKRHMWPGKTKGVRMPVEKLPVLNKRGKVKRYEEYDWFKTVMSGYLRRDKMRTAVDDFEDAKDLKAIKPEKKEAKEGEETLQGYKQSADFVLERHLRREEAILPGSEPVKTFVTGKGDKTKEEPVYRRKDVVVCHTGESWHKEGRQVKAGEHPMKMVPVRAVTLARKREVEEAERDTGEKLKQGLYSWDQTEWIIPPPIENGIIPKNAFGNMDCFVPTMVPKGAVHIPLRGTMKICKRLGIDYAEAVTGFEFGNQRAVPVITGVIVATEHEDLVIDSWEKAEEERRIKEEAKREKAALAMWRKFLMGLKIIERVREEYGNDADAHMKEEMNPFTNKNKKAKLSNNGSTGPSNANSLHAGINTHEDTLGGGFLPDGEDDEEHGESTSSEIVPELIEDTYGGGFVPEDADLEETTLPHGPKSMNTEDMQFQFTKPNGVDEANSEEDSSKLPTAKPTTRNINGNISKNSRSQKNPKTKSTPKSKTKPKTRISKRQAPPDEASPKADSESEAGLPPSEPKASAATKPKRKAARKSETALKSHYFATSGTEDEGTDHETEGSEEQVAYKPPGRKAKSKVVGTGEAPKAKRGRPRKTM